MLFPWTRPNCITPAGPAIFHSDLARITTGKPAIAGEVLSLFATGLGPTSPDVDLTQPFPLSPPSTVNAPVTVTVGGIAADVVSALGVPAAWNGYRVDFRVPANTSRWSEASCIDSGVDSGIAS